MAERTAKRLRTRLLMVLASVCVALLLCVAALWALETWGGGDVRRRLWQARVQLFGPEPVGIWQDHERLGWVHIPSSEGRQRAIPDYDVRYHIDEHGHRRIPGGPEGVAPAVLFLGGSFTFGHGVEDDETYTAQLQAAWPEYRVINAAVNAWGTIQALLSLEEELAKNDSIELVVYGFITHHLLRNHRSGPWLKVLAATRNRRSPYFDLEEGELVFRGLADPERDGRERNETQKRQERNMTARLLREMDRVCVERGVPFVVVQLPDGGSSSSEVPMLERAVGSDAVIDVEAEVDYKTLRFANDLHLTPAGHAEVARVLKPRLEARLEGSGK